MKEHAHSVSRLRPRAPTLVVAGLAATLLAAGGCVTVRYRPAPRPVTVHQVIAWSKASVPAKAIIHRMKVAHMVYRLDASELARLHAKGVPDPVINYMQHTYLAAVRHNQKLHDWRYWWSGPDGYWYGGPEWNGDWGGGDED